MQNQLMDGEGNLRKVKPPRMYVKDDEGFFWYFDPEIGTIRMDGDDSGDIGYFCSDLEDGYRELVELGYITPAQEE